MTRMTLNFRRSRPRLSALLLAGSLLSVTACGDDDDATSSLQAIPPIQTVVVTPGTNDIRVGSTQQLAAQLINENGQPVSNATVTWFSQDTTVATVSATGLVTVRGPGATAIGARVGSFLGFAGITAIAPVTAVTVTSPVTSLQTGLTAQLEIAPRDANGTPLSRAFTITSSNPSVATVTSTGLVTAVAAGTTTITVTSEGITGSVPLTVVAPAPVSTVTIAPTGALLLAGGTQQLTVTLRDASGTVLTGRPITYTSSAPAVATVSSTGLVTQVTAGVATITATSEGRTGTIQVGNGVLGGINYTVGGAESSDVSWTIAVPAGASRVVVTLAGGSGDPDLYVYRPGSTTIDCRSENDGPGESCTLDNVAAGSIRVRVIGFTAYSGTTLRATITP